MTPPLPIVSGREAVRALEKADSPSQLEGELRQAAQRSGRTVMVPLHRELARGMLASILRQAELSVNEFRELL